jgi:hypothetical protein
MNHRSLTVEIWPGTGAPAKYFFDEASAIELSQLRRNRVIEYFKLSAQGMLSSGVRGEH